MGQGIYNGLTAEGMSGLQETWDGTTERETPWSMAGGTSMRLDCCREGCCRDRDALLGKLLPEGSYILSKNRVIPGRLNPTELQNSHLGFVIQ